MDDDPVFSIGNSPGNPLTPFSFHLGKVLFFEISLVYVFQNAEFITLGNYGENWSMYLHSPGNFLWKELWHDPLPSSCVWDIPKKTFLRLGFRFSHLMKQNGRWYSVFQRKFPWLSPYAIFIPLWWSFSFRDISGLCIPKGRVHNLEILSCWTKVDIASLDPSGISLGPRAHCCPSFILKSDEGEKRVEVISPPPPV